ncbi:MAG TPA: Hpt domain-containing protein [Flavobacteriales bacterium]
MPSPIDLSFLERFCNGDRARMARYIALYLSEAPALFTELEMHALSDDAEALAATAHSIRPMAHQMGAQELMEALTTLEERVRTEGVQACTALIEDVLARSAEADAALQQASTGPLEH